MRWGARLIKVHDRLVERGLSNPAVLHGRWEKDESGIRAKG
jgi:hypothetical protein